MTFNLFMRRAGIILAAIWIFGGSLFYYIRFTSIFYHANESAIHKAIQALFP